jgi:hypothetical protein
MASKDISGKQALLMIPLTKFFGQRANIEKLQEVLDGRGVVSLRLIDWFVTNYAKKNNIMYNLRDFKTPAQAGDVANFKDLFNVFNNYKSQLKSFNKKNFDPFCRRVRIHFYYTKDKYLSTTVGQLNFFKWLLETHIIDYIKQNLAAIEDDMNLTIKKEDAAAAVPPQPQQPPQQPVKPETKKIKQSVLPPKEKKTIRKKRRELSEPMSKSIIRHNMPITITFD